MTRRDAAGEGPDFSRERAWIAQIGDGARIAGVDEVGRGPLAGPVVAAAAVLAPEAAAALAAAGLDDSKKLGARAKSALMIEIRRLADLSLLDIALGGASSAEIDRRNIRQATHLAMRRAVARLAAPPNAALVDGSDDPGLPVPVRTVIRGDGASLSIAAAALVAKVVRDRAMTRLAARWPAYAWDRNKGYPSAAHRDALSRHGPTPHHRLSFNGCANGTDDDA